MLRPFIKRLISATSIFILIGCRNYKCSDRVVLTTYVGFNPTDIDTFIIRRYEPNSNYSTLIDTFLIINAANNGGIGNGKYTTTGDTTIVFVDNSYPENGIYPGYDWKIFIPATNKTIFISGIVSMQNIGEKNCSNPITSFYQDSILVTSPMYFETDHFITTGYRAYIHP